MSDPIQEAIQSAKSMRRADADGGPLVPADKVLLMELCWAAEILIEPEINIEFQYIENVYEQVLGSLQRGKLIAFTLA